MYNYELDELNAWMYVLNIRCACRADNIKVCSVDNIKVCVKTQK